MKTRDEMKALRAKTMAELDTDLKAKKSELFNLRFQLATGQLQNTAAINECRKFDCARADRDARDGRQVMGGGN